MDPSSLTMLGKYEIRGTLGRGAMGIVYDGWDPQIDRRVAIKTVRLPDAEDAEAIDALALFKREAQAAGRLSHPNIVGVHEYGQTSAMAGGDLAYIVMEFVEGQSLKALLDAEERFPVGETVRVMEELLAGLQFSHARGVIHRDIKPANVMVTTDGRVKIADFGIARIENNSSTQTGKIVGSPAYMSPEQFMGQPVDARTDVYSSGVLLYQMLTGERPFEGSVTGIMHKVLNTTPQRPSKLSVIAPPSLDLVVARAMQRRAEDRFASAAEFAKELRRASESPTPAGIVAAAESPNDEDATRRPWKAPSVSASALAPVRAATPSQASRALLMGGVATVSLVILATAVWLALRPPGIEPAAHSAAGKLQPAEPSKESDRQTSLQQVPAAGPPVSPGPSSQAPPVPPSSEMNAPTREALQSDGLRGQAAMPVPLTLTLVLANVARSAHCALPRFGVSGAGQVEVSGLVGAGAPESDLREAVRNVAPHSPTTWRVRSFVGPYCRALDILQPIAGPGRPVLGLALKNEAAVLKNYDAIFPILTLPGFPAHLIVDYLSSDGSVMHLFPARGSPDKIFHANASVPLGDQIKGVGGGVGPPFGTDMIIAVASSVQLFPNGRQLAQAGAVETYLPALQDAIEAARRQNARLAGSALVFETVP